VTESELRAATRRFVAALCEPVGPWVFAGQGGHVATLRYEAALAAGGDALGGVLAAEAAVGELRRAWAEEAPLPLMFVVLFDLLAPPPGEAKDRWREEVMDLLVLCGRRDRSGLAAEMARRSQVMGSVVAELELWLAEDAVER
jgi:hypothetical protein